MAKPTNRNTKKAPSAVRVGGGKRGKQTVWYRRRSALLFALAFAVVGTVLLVLTHANNTPNCFNRASNGSTLNVCLNTAPSYNALQASTDYVAVDNQSVMTSANLGIELCSPQTLACHPVDTSTTIRLYNAQQPRYQRLYTHGVTLLRGATYRVCFGMTTNQGWTISHACSKILTYNDNINNAPQVFADGNGQQPAAAQASVASSSPDATDSNSTSCNTAPLKKDDGSTWACTFDDEFDGPSLDATKWTAVPTASAGFSAAPDCYVNSPNNISVSGGTLNLTSRKEAAPFACYSPARGNYSAQVTSATVSTSQKFSQQYGRFEIRAKVPNVTTQGLQQSFWLWPDKPFDQDPANAGWPATGEIDIAEMYHAVSDRAIPYVHYVPATTDFNITDNYCYIDISQYHTYVLTWTPDTIKIDVDGYNCVLDHPSPRSPQASPQPFNKTFFLNLTSGLGLSVNGNGYIDGTTPLPATTQVDYVRIWK